MNSCNFALRFDNACNFLYNQNVMCKIKYLYDNYIFDLYGTLVDILTDEDSDCFWQKIADMLHCDSAELKATYKSLCNQKQSEVGEECEFDLLEVFDYIVKKYDSDLTKEELAYRFRKTSIVYESVFPFVKYRLRQLKRHGKGVYLISNAQSCFTRRELEELGLDNLFDGIVISSEIGYKKPSPLIFEKAFEQFGIAKSSCLYSGNDPVDDIQGASAFGIPSFLVTHKPRRKIASK